MARLATDSEAADSGAAERLDRIESAARRALDAVRGHIEALRTTANIAYRGWRRRGPLEAARPVARFSGV